MCFGILSIISLSKSISKKTHCSVNREVVI